MIDYDDVQLAVFVNRAAVTLARARRLVDGSIVLDVELSTGTVVHAKAPSETAARQLADALGLVLLQGVSHTVRLGG